MHKTGALFAFLAVTLMIWANDTAAGDFKAGDMTVSSLWARSTALKARTGAVFMTIKNGGADTDRLLAIKTPVAGHAGFHLTVMEQDVMRMRPVKAIEVPPGGMVVLKPGSYHVMLMALESPLKEGSSFPMSLTFDRAGEVRVMVKVMKAGAMGDGHPHHRH